MTQIINILRKDIRHLRLEILASVAVLLLFLVVEPRAWAELYGSALSASQIVAGLVCVSWGIIILRLVHAERLAGSNQFWTTRPYEWPKLLAAKALFVILFVYVPLVLAQFYLLHHAGFSIAANLSPLLHNLLRVTCVLVLPLACIAAVTTSFGQAALSLLGFAVLLAALQSAFNYLGSVSATIGLPRRAPLFILSAEFAIVVAFLSAVLLLQYSRRLTMKSIAILGSAVVLLIATQQILAGSAAAASGYATGVSDAPASIAIDTSKRQAFSMWLPRNTRTAMYAVPLQFSNFTPGVTLSLEAQRYTLTTAEGYTWTSNWLTDYSFFDSLRPKSSSSLRSFLDIPWSVYPHVAGHPVSIRIEFLASQLANDTPYTYSLPNEAHSVPHVGVCKLDDAEENLLCRGAFGNFSLVDVSTTGSPDPCDGSADAAPTTPAPLIPETGSLVGTRRLTQNPMPEISPVMINMVHLNPPHPNDQRTGYLCPGTPVTFAAKHFERHVYIATPPATITLNEAPRGGRVGP